MLSCIAIICTVMMILNYFCLLPAQFCDKVKTIQNFESHMQIADRCAPYRIANSAENLACRRWISKDRCLPQIPRRGRHKSLLVCGEVV
jgi:hypothetical protein